MTAIILLAILSFLLVWQFVGYPLFMGLLALLDRRPMANPEGDNPYVTVVVPTYNEEASILKRLENLDAQEYPKDKYEVIVVDSGSKDRTFAIAEEFKSTHAGPSHPAVSLIQEGERNGKPSAVALAMKQAQGEIMLVTDANATFQQDAIIQLMKHFSDPNVGGVGGRYVVANTEDPVAMSEAFYWDLEYMMRKGEARLGSACLFHGEINAWRKELVTPDPRIMGDDLDQALQIRRAGYRIAYEPEAIVSEVSATSMGDQITERKRTTIGTLQCISKHARYLLLPRDMYTIFIFPSHKLVTMVSPFMIGAILVLYGVVFDWRIVLIHAGITGAVFGVLLIALLLLRNKLITTNRPVESGFSAGKIPRIAWYVLVNEYLLLLAWKDYLLRNYSVRWEQLRSTRL